MQRCGEFRESKEDKKSEAHPAKPEKAKPGAFRALEGMRTVGNSKNQARKPGAECIPFPYNSCKKETGENPVFPPVLRQGQKDLVTPAAPGAAPSGERPAPAEAGAETGAAERHRGSLAPRHAILEWMWEQPTGSGGVPVLAGSALSPKGGGLWPPALPARPQSEFLANPGGICLGCGNSW